MTSPLKNALGSMFVFDADATEVEIALKVAEQLGGERRAMRKLAIDNDQLRSENHSLRNQINALTVAERLAEMTESSS